MIIFQKLSQALLATFTITMLAANPLDAAYQSSDDTTIEMAYQVNPVQKLIQEKLDNPKGFVNGLIALSEYCTMVSLTKLLTDGLNAEGIELHDISDGTTNPLTYLPHSEFESKAYLNCREIILTVAADRKQTLRLLCTQSYFNIGETIIHKIVEKTEDLIFAPLDYFFPRNPNK